MVSCGRKIRFWELLIGHTPLKNFLHDIYNISSLHDAAMVDFFDAQGWNLFLRRILND